MLKNFLTTAFRNLWKNKGVSIQNISGLAVGLATFLLIIFYVIDEISYDRYNTQYDRIFRVNTELKYGGALTAFAVAAPPLAEALMQNFPEVEKAVRLTPFKNVRFKKGEEVVREDGVVYADPDLFDVFTLPVIYGDPQTALTTPDAIVLTESAAKKYFNGTDVLEKTLTLVDDTTQLTITAVIEDIPEQSHFRADFFRSLTSLASARKTNFNQFTFHTYALLKTGANEKALEAKFPAFLRKHLDNNMNMDEFEKSGNYIRIGFTPLKDIHLHSNRQGELAANSDVRYVYIFSG